jgi:sRNA-binding carbon storage regulator CsrA
MGFNADKKVNIVRKELIGKEQKNDPSREPVPGSA